MRPAVITVGPLTVAVILNTDPDEILPIDPVPAEYTLI
jgi:hypothetical protein